MLLFYGHTSHVNKPFLLRCLHYHVLPACLPPHTTHLLQPLDLSVLSPLIRAYSDIPQEQDAKGERAAWKGNPYKLLDHAQQVAFTPENIRSEFHATGLCPVDFNIIQRKLRMSNSESAREPPVADSKSENQESELEADSDPSTYSKPYPMPGPPPLPLPTTKLNAQPFATLANPLEGSSPASRS